MTDGDDLDPLEEALHNLREYADDLERSREYANDLPLPAALEAFKENILRPLEQAANQLRGTYRLYSEAKQGDKTKYWSYHENARLECHIALKEMVEEHPAYFQPDSSANPLPETQRKKFLRLMVGVMDAMDDFGVTFEVDDQDIYDQIKMASQDQNPDERQRGGI